MFTFYSWEFGCWKLGLGFRVLLMDVKQLILLVLGLNPCMVGGMKSSEPSGVVDSLVYNPHNDPYIHFPTPLNLARGLGDTDSDYPEP